MYVNGTVADLDRDDPEHNYFATSAADDDVRGVPRALQEVTAYPGAAETLDGGEGIEVRYVVERLCSAPGPPVIETCALSPPSVDAAAGFPAPGEPAATPYYRVTVRADGPGGTRVIDAGDARRGHAGTSPVVACSRRVSAIHPRTGMWNPGAALPSSGQREVTVFNRV